MVINNPRDSRIAAWLATWATPEQIEAKAAELGSRAWPARVAKQLGRGQIPPEIWDEPRGAPSPEIAARLAELKKSLK